MIVGIDNGLDGGLVAVNSDGIVGKRPMPTLKLGKGREVCALGVRSWLAEYRGATILLEQAGKHAAGVLSLCSTWHTFGAIKAVLTLDGHRFEIVPPQRWQQAFWTRPKMAKGVKFDTKAAALAAANRLWPGEEWTKSDRSRKPHDGMIDAALIAEWGRRNNL